MTETQKNKKLKKDEKKKNLSTLLIWNDDVNSFDHIINSLVDICEHTTEQAEQCALIAHNTGKCNVKSGEKEELNIMKKALNNRLIEATIED